MYGPKNALVLDHDHQTLIKVSGERYKSYLEKFVTPLIFGKQYPGNGVHNVRKFLKNDFHMKSGMKVLIEEFYRSIAEDAPLPIPYKEIVLIIPDHGRHIRADIPIRSGPTSIRVTDADEMFPMTTE